MSRILNLSKEQLQMEYNSCGSMQKMADKLNVSVDSIYKYMKQFGIQYCKYYKGTYVFNNEFFNLNTENSFYWAGFIAADGCVMERKNQKSLKITLAIKDINHLIKFKNALKSTHPINTYLSVSKKGKISASCQIVLCGPKIFNSLNRFNIIPRKTFIYKMPDWLLNHKLLSHFLRGYFDGDGCISFLKLQKGRVIKQGNFSVIGTNDLVKQFKLVLINHGLNQVKICKRKNIYSLVYSGNTNIRNIYNYLYQENCTCLERKFERFQTLLSR